MTHDISHMTYHMTHITYMYMYMYHMTYNTSHMTYHTTHNISHMTYHIWHTFIRVTAQCLTVPGSNWHSHIMRLAFLRSRDVNLDNVVRIKSNGGASQPQVQGRVDTCDVLCMHVCMCVCVCVCVCVTFQYSRHLQ